MSTMATPSPDRPDWKALYRAAIVETDKNALPQRVSAAEKAVVARSREIFYGYGSQDEKESLDDALYALHALRSAWHNSSLNEL